MNKYSDLTFDDLTSTAEVALLTGVPEDAVARYFEDECVHVLNASTLTEPKRLREVGRRMFFEPDFRPEKDTEFARMAWKSYVNARDYAFALNERALIEDEAAKYAAERTGFTLRQLGIQFTDPWKGGAGKPMFVKTDVITKVQNEVEGGLYADGSVIRHVLALGSDIYRGRFKRRHPVQPTGTFSGQLEWAEAVNTSLVTEARKDGEETVCENWLEGGEMDREAFLLDYGNPLFVAYRQRLKSEKGAHGEDIRAQVYADLVPLSERFEADTEAAAQAA